MRQTLASGAGAVVPKTPKTGTTSGNDGLPERAATAWLTGTSGSRFEDNQLIKLDVSQKSGPVPGYMFS